MFNHPCFVHLFHVKISFPRVPLWLDHTGVEVDRQKFDSDIVDFDAGVDETLVFAGTDIFTSRQLFHLPNQIVEVLFGQMVNKYCRNQYCIFTGLQRVSVALYAKWSVCLNDFEWPLNWATTKCIADALFPCIAELLVISSYSTYIPSAVSVPRLRKTMMLIVFVMVRAIN